MKTENRDTWRWPQAKDYWQSATSERGKDQILPGVSGERVAWCYAALGPGIVKKDWVLKNWYFQIVMLEKTPESPVDCKEIQPVNSQGIQSWILSLEGLLLKLKLQYFCHLMWRVDSLEKNPDAGKDWRQKRTRQQRMRCLDSTTDSVDMNLCKLEDIEEGGSLACCSPWGHKLLDTI